MRIPQSELNIPNFIELCLEKVNKNGANSGLNNKDNRVLLKFGTTKLFIQEMDQEPVEQEYKNVLYLNNSITNENFFCLAYSSGPLSKAASFASKLSTVINHLFIKNYRKYSFNFPCQTKVFLRYMPY
jgi:hypothetical protein